MQRQVLVLLLALVVSLPSSPLAAQEDHSDHHATADVGRVHFPVSCTESVRGPFERAVAMLHSFWYEEAEKAFAAIAETDPTCAMADWGVAMSLWHPLWDQPDPPALEKGWAAVEKAEALEKQTDRERLYLVAIAAFYRDHDTVDYGTRALAYEKAMAELHARYPDDREATVFYALAVRANASPTDKSYAKQEQAAELLNAVLAEEPDHPGVTHYLIHAYDYPGLAELALPAARRYASIAPAVPHALHMPSHIFTRLGLWDESIESNLATEKAAKDYAAKAGIQGAWAEQLHAMDYLMYAYLQTARDSSALGVLEDLRGIQSAAEERIASAYAFAAIPARYALERGDWRAAPALTLGPTSFPWSRFRWAEAITEFARALGAAHTGDLATAREDVEKLIAIRQSLEEARDSYWAGQVEVQRLAAEASIAHAEGRDDEALEGMRKAADLEDTMDKHPATPGPVLPARELLGDLLLEVGRPEQALTEYEAVLESAPGRLRSVHGAARAAEQAGDLERARSHYAELDALAARAEGSRPELREARVFLSRR